MERIAVGLVVHLSSFTAPAIAVIEADGTQHVLAIGA